MSASKSLSIHTGASPKSRSKVFESAIDVLSPASLSPPKSPPGGFSYLYANSFPYQIQTTPLLDDQGLSSDYLPLKNAFPKRRRRCGVLCCGGKEGHPCYTLGRLSLWMLLTIFVGAICFFAFMFWPTAPDFKLLNLSAVPSNKIHSHSNTTVATAVFNYKADFTFKNSNAFPINLDKINFTFSLIPNDGEGATPFRLSPDGTLSLNEEKGTITLSKEQVLVDFDIDEHTTKHLQTTFSLAFQCNTETGCSHIIDSLNCIHKKEEGFKPLDADIRVSFVLDWLQSWTGYIYSLHFPMTLPCPK